MEGVPLRDWFAGKAIDKAQGAEREVVNVYFDDAEMVIHAYRIADAMMAERLTYGSDHYALLDWHAGNALSWVSQRGGRIIIGQPDWIAAEAYRIANAALAASAEKEHT